jgi:hypothetical protein
VVAVLESAGEASAAEVSAAQAATEATATHGTAEVPAAKAPTHAPAEVATTTAEVPAAHASAPMTASAATARNGVGRDGGTSQCRGNNDDRNSVRHKFLHGRYLFLSQMTPRYRCSSAESSDLA